MKPILLILLLAVGGLRAQDFSDPVRLVNDHRVSLQPLFNWWTNAGAILATNAARTNVAPLPLPPRPLTAWVRVVSHQLTNTGFAWLARAAIQETPDGPFTEQLIALRHGPFEETKRFDRAVRHFQQAGDALLVASNQYVQKMEITAQFDQKANLYQEMYALDPWQHHRLGDAAVAYRQAADQAYRQALNAAQRVEQLNQQRIELHQITQGRDAMEVDTFALRTGEKYRGLPVYEMGLRFGR
ncbi:MAG TPA: hypothetical protein PKN95_05125 [Verrucomicrobiota bacterium]|nr:hypothetical protein [Verrucomicrobiota bacterium]HNT15168.1 hypothetical protein [Verrucomicrobiota bacterium]